MARKTGSESPSCFVWFWGIFFFCFFFFGGGCLVFSFFCFFFFFCKILDAPAIYERNTTLEVAVNPCTNEGFVLFSPVSLAARRLCEVCLARTPIHYTKLLRGSGVAVGISRCRNLWLGGTETTLCKVRALARFDERFPTNSRAHAWYQPPLTKFPPWSRLHRQTSSPRLHTSGPVLAAHRPK